jgi:heme/copper-type cytochrome/quinol oxidase subunit 4
MNQWALAAIAVLLIGYGALSGRLQSTMVTKAMAFIEATLTLVLFTYLDLWTAAALASILAPTDVADASTSHLGFRCTIRA